MTTEKEVGAEAATSSTDRRPPDARPAPAQPEAVVDTEAVQADIAAVAPPRAEAPADDAATPPRPRRVAHPGPADHDEPDLPRARDHSPCRPGRGVVATTTSGTTATT